jgi:hypothetical protein
VNDARRILELHVEVIAVEDEVVAGVASADSGSTIVLSSPPQLLIRDDLSRFA